MDVLIIMQQQKDWPADLHACKDKFLVQSLVLDPNQVASIGASSPRLRPTNPPYKNALSRPPLRQRARYGRHDGEGTSTAISTR